MPAGQETRHLLYGSLSVLFIWSVLHLVWLTHPFTHLGSPSHLFDNSLFIVGSTIILLLDLLLFSLVIKIRRLMRTANKQANSCVDLLYENACFKAVDHHFDDMVHLNTMSGDILYTNGATKKILGYEPSELVGRPAHKLIHPEDRDSVAGDMSSLAVGNISSSIREIRLLRKDGTHIPVGVKGFPVEIGGQSYLGAVIKDLTMEKESQVLFDIKRDFEQSINAIQDFISIHDNNFRVIKVNKALADYLGKTPDEIRGRYCYELFHNSSQPHVNCPHGKVMAKEKSFTEEINDFDQGMSLKITCTPLHDKAGKLKGSIHHAKLINGDDKKLADEEGLKQYRELIFDLKKKDFMMLMCAGCNKYKDGNSEWQQISSFFQRRTSIQLSHGICPDCAKNLYPEFSDVNTDRATKKWNRS